MQATENVVRPEYKIALTSYLQALSGVVFGDPMDLFAFLRAYDRHGQIIPERVILCPGDIRFLERAHNTRANIADYEVSQVMLMADRIVTARNTWGLTNKEIADCMEVSEDDVDDWCEGRELPSRVSQLADVLQVPVVWLDDGCSRNLPANSPVGFFVGNHGAGWRKRLYRMTNALLAQIPSYFDLDTKQRYILEVVMSRQSYSRAARHGGGYWQLGEDGALAFRYWDTVYQGPIGQDNTLTEVGAPRVAPVYAAWRAIEPLYPLIKNGDLFEARAIETLPSFSKALSA